MVCDMDSEKPKEEQGVDIIPDQPSEEVEDPGIVCTVNSAKPGKRSGVFQSRSYSKNHLEVKDSSALVLAYVCLFTIVVVWLIDFLFVGNGKESASSVIDILKYVVTTSVGFFFGASNKKQI
jgi:hypothetical protein